jgi:hypothetical protein
LYGLFCLFCWRFFCWCLFFMISSTLLFHLSTTYHHVFAQLSCFQEFPVCLLLVKQCCRRSSDSVYFTSDITSPRLWTNIGQKCFNTCFFGHKWEHVTSQRDPVTIRNWYPQGGGAPVIHVAGLFCQSNYSCNRQKV